MLWMDSMGSNIAAGELAKDVDGAEQMIKEHNERKVRTVIVWHTCMELYVITLICICSVISNPCKHVYVSYVLCVCARVRVCVCMCVCVCHCIVCGVCVCIVCMGVCCVYLCCLCLVCACLCIACVCAYGWISFKLHYYCRMRYKHGMVNSLLLNNMER